MSDPKDGLSAGGAPGPGSGAAAKTVHADSSATVDLTSTPRPSTVSKSAPPPSGGDSGATIDLSSGVTKGGVTIDLSAPLGTIDKLVVSMDSSSSTVNAAAARRTAVPNVPRLPGYEILGELGRGGMGVVYKARQTKLGRVVALKMVLAGGHAGPEQLARFQIEAQAVASLQHPNIVQIYEVGEHESLPHFSLEFVDGAPLDKALAGKPLAPENAAKLLETLATAMQFAHEHGIVHRDLKPANVLLSSQGTPKITDFGLAKKLEGDSNQTKSGTLMGTPSYMAPEQARGEFKELGPSADVYSLGAMLYEMLVGRPPFLGTNPLDTVLQVLNEEPVPPSRLVPKLPRDIETICLKCLQKEPAKRYASARDLAEDCRRFINGEPIVSRPISGVERAWRWCRRNPRVAGLLAAVAGLLIVVAVGSTVSALTIAQERNLKEAQRKQAVDAKLTAEEASRLAEERRVEAEEASRLAEERRVQAEDAKKEADEQSKIATDQAGLALSSMQILVDKVQTQLEDAPRTQKLKKELLETAMEGLKAVAKRAEGSTSIEVTMLAAHMRMGNMFRQLGATEEAMKEFIQCNEIARRRAAARPDNESAQGNLVAVLTVLGDMHQELRRDVAESLKCYREALDICEDLNGRSHEGEGAMTPLAVKQKLAEAHTRVAVALLRQGNPAAALPSFEKSLEIRRELVALNPDAVALRQDLARSFNAVGEVASLLGDTAKAHAYYDESIALRESMLAADPEDVRARSELAETWGNYGDLALREGRAEVAGKAFEKCRLLNRELLALDEENIAFRINAATADYRLGLLALRSAAAADATAHFESCRTDREKIVATDPTNQARRTELMLALAHCGELARATAMAAEARAGKKDTAILVDVARCHAQCYRSLLETAPAEAQKLADEAIACLGEAIEGGYSDAVTLRTDPDLDPIRGLDGFKVLEAKLGEE